MPKVVQGDEMFFKDDIQIIDVEIATPLNMPNNIPIFSRDELQIFYNGHIFVASEEETPDASIKVYTETFGLKEIASPKEQEDEYFAANSALMDKLKEDFIERTVNGISILDDQNLKGTLGNQVSSELVEKITQEYASLTPSRTYTMPGKGLVTKLNDSSIFNTYMQGSERVLILDGKVYLLATMSEYLAQFERSFKPAFYTQVTNMCNTAAPEKVSQLLTDNADKIHEKALPVARNKIWHSKRSFKLHLDGIYWIPEFKGKTDDMIAAYQRLLERKVKIDAAKEYI